MAFFPSIQHEFGPDFSSLHGLQWMLHSTPIDGGLVEPLLTLQQLDLLTTEQILHRRMPRNVFLTDYADSLFDNAERWLYDRELEKALNAEIGEETEYIDYRKFRKLDKQLKRQTRYL